MSFENWMNYNDDILLLSLSFLIVAGGILAFLYWFIKGGSK